MSRTSMTTDWKVARSSSLSSSFSDRKDSNPKKLRYLSSSTSKDISHQDGVFRSSYPVYAPHYDHGSKDATVGAWEVIKQFAHTMGLSLNEGKTGAMELSGSPVAAREFEPSDQLPSGPITWGFLKMGPSGKWIIDDAYVQLHTDELKLQLEATKSIFAWVQAWNAYAVRFLSNNVGEPANCLGRAHLDDVIGVMEKIQNKLVRR